MGKRSRKRLRSVLALSVLMFFTAGAFAPAWSDPPRKPVKRMAPKKPLSKRTAKPTSAKKPVKRATPKKSTSTTKPVNKVAPKKSTSATKTVKKAAPKKSTSAVKSSGRRTISGVSGRKVSARDARAASARLRSTSGKIKTDRSPLTSKRLAEIKARLQRTQGSRFTGKVMARGSAAFSKVPENKRAEVREAFKNGEARVIKLDREVVVYRRVGGSNKDRPSAWYTDKPYVRPGNAKRYLSLPKSNTAQEVRAYRIPKGTEILIGKAGPMTGKSRFGTYAVGGGTQIYVPKGNEAVKPI